MSSEAASRSNGNKAKAGAIIPSPLNQRQVTRKLNDARGNTTEYSCRKHMEALGFIAGVKLVSYDPVAWIHGDAVFERWHLNESAIRRMNDIIGTTDIVAPFEKLGLFEDEADLAGLPDFLFVGEESFAFVESKARLEGLKTRQKIRIMELVEKGYDCFVYCQSVDEAFQMQEAKLHKAIIDQDGLGFKEVMKWEKP